MRSTIVVTLTFALLGLALLVSPARARESAAQEPPDLSRASAAILIDARDGAVLASKRPDTRRSIASATKLMTALLTLEETRPRQVFGAADYAAAPTESRLGLQPGEQMRVEDLFEALLLASANDAAATLAEGIAGSRAAFVERMNERVRALGLRNTSYANPVGLDSSQNYSTARDLASLSRRLLRDQRFARVVDMPSATLASGARTRTVSNRNLLVGRYPFVDGVKTGHTVDAGYVLVGAARGPFGSQVISVVLGEPSEAARDADSLALLRYGRAQFRRVKALDADRPVASVPIVHRDGRARLLPKRDALLVARRGERIRARIDAPDELEGELATGTRVGQVVVTRDGRVVRRVPLITAASVPAPESLTLIAAELPRILIGVLALAVALALGSIAVRERIRRRDAAREARRRARERARTSV